VNDILNNIKTYQKAFEQGLDAGKHSALWELQKKIHEVAEASGVNKYEAQYVNKVVMLSDVDKVINEILESK
jgi:hypothetical protein